MRLVANTFVFSFVLVSATAEAGPVVELSYNFFYKSAFEGGEDEYIERKASGAIPVELGKTYELTNVSFGGPPDEGESNRSLMVTMTPSLVSESLYKVDFVTFIRVGERPLTRTGSILLKMREDSSVKINDVHEQLLVGVKIRPLTNE